MLSLQVPEQEMMGSFASVPVPVPVFTLRANLWELSKVDSGNEDTEPEKTSVEPKDSETLNLVLDTVQHDYFPSASIEEKFDFPVSESRGVWFEGKPPVIIDDYVGCRKYFDSGEVDAKIFRELPFPEKSDPDDEGFARSTFNVIDNDSEVIFELRRSNSSPF